MQKMTTASLLMASLLPPAPAPAGQFTSSLGQYPNDGYLRPKQLQELNILPFSMSTMWRKVKTGEFPQPVKLSDAITGFRVGEIREWLLDPQNYGGMDKGDRERTARDRRTALFLGVTGLRPTNKKSKASANLIDVIRKHMQIDHLSFLERNGELFVLNEPYGDHTTGVQGLIAQGLSVIKVPINLAPYCGKFSFEKDSQPWTTSYLISAKPTTISQDIAERLELADVFAPAWNT